jgi:hypothetical protein
MTLSIMALNTECCFFLV